MFVLRQTMVLQEEELMGCPFVTTIRNDGDMISVNEINPMRSDTMFVEN